MQNSKTRQDIAPVAFSLFLCRGTSFHSLIWQLLHWADFPACRPVYAAANDPKAAVAAGYPLLSKNGWFATEDAAAPHPEKGAPFGFLLLALKSRCPPGGLSYFS